MILHYFGKPNKKFGYCRPIEMARLQLFCALITTKNRLIVFLTDISVVLWGYCCASHRTVKQNFNLVCGPIKQTKK